MAGGPKFVHLIRADSTVGDGLHGGRWSRCFDPPDQAIGKSPNIVPTTVADRGKQATVRLFHNELRAAVVSYMRW